MSLISLKEIVGIFLDEINGGKAEFARAYRIAIRGWRELNTDVTGYPKIVKLDVECDLTVELPKDYLNYISVGIINEKGDLATLTKNNRLTAELSDGYGTYTEDWYNYDANLNIVRGSLGIGSNVNIGEYRIDKSSNRIILNPEFCYREITLEYLSNGQEEGKECIDELAMEALVSYIRWKWHIAKKGVTQGDKVNYRSEYYNQKRLAKFRLRKPKVQEMNQNSRENTKFSVKS